MITHPLRRPLLTLALFTFWCGAAVAAPVVSGIHPHLAMFNEEGECGTGAVVPWAGRLWVITYAPHMPKGSSDKLYEITPDLQQIIRPESVGGTPANRMIHPESGQLFIGPYAIDSNRTVRVITPAQMFGRLTGNARHLTDPTRKIYFATMEEGLYEVDVATLAVTKLWKDNADQEGRDSKLPGYHGKGLYSGQGQVIYANNGERGQAALTKPETPSGVLAEWDGKAEAWTVVRRNQFTEVTGPGGLTGNPNPAHDPIWSVGWDHRSVLLQVRAAGAWHTYRLPKASHSYDGAHGWNTEWPRIRDIGAPGQPDLLMTMHGLFWRFPRTFAPGKAAGIRPRSAYLKVIGDFCRWNDQLVFGCDDTAKSEFLNKRKVKGGLGAPGQSQSNLWFTDPEQPDRLGPATAEGAVWTRDAVAAGETSDPFLCNGWPRRGAWLANGGATPVTFTLEADADGAGTWSTFRAVTLAAGAEQWLEISATATVEWMRVRSTDACSAATVHFAFATPDARPATPAAIFAGLARPNEPALSGHLRTRGGNLRTLAVGQSDALYELDAALNLRPVADTNALAVTLRETAIPRNLVVVDAASVLITDDQGRRWRLPRGAAALDAPTRDGELRIAREVATERDLLSCHGTFYELPAENAGGFARVRPIASHPFAIRDYCSYRGLLVMSGVLATGAAPRVVRSADGQAAVWTGVIDDLWQLGRPTGQGGPWRDTAVAAGVASDPYLFGFYEQRLLSLSHTAATPVQITVEFDPSGDGNWMTFEQLTVPAGESLEKRYPPALSARWIRFTADRAATVTAQLTYD